MSPVLPLLALQALLCTSCYLAGRRHMRRRLQTSHGRQRAGWRAPSGGGYRPAVSTPEPDTAPIGRAGTSPPRTSPTLLATLVVPPRLPTAEMGAVR